ncbi:MAG: DMT family transporter [Clostridia bacterium]|nr:DMT family transporter [Clostridia bacterium]MBR3129344.1 DMT family transporter [Clostridia bacterium]
MEQKSDPKRILGHVFALFSVVVWGSCYVLTKNLLNAGFTALQITPIRLALAYVVLLCMRPKFQKLPAKDELIFVLLGLFGGSVYFFLQNTALTYTYAANVSIIICLTPIFTALLAWVFSRGNERLGKYLWLGSALAIAGVVLVVLNGSLHFHLSPKGDILALAAGISWAVYSILIKRYTETMDGFLITRRVMFWAFVTAVPLMLLTDGMPNLAPLFTDWKVLLSWLFLGILGNAVCFALWNIAFVRLGVVVTNNYLYGSPFVTLLVGWLLLGEPISWMGLIGAVLITVGVILAQRK